MRFLLLCTLLCLALAHKIPNQFIVVFKQEAPAFLVASHLSERVGIFSTYDFAGFRGYAAHMNSTNAALVARLPEVAYVEADVMMMPAQTCVMQTGRLSWGLDRVNHRVPPTSEENLVYRYQQGNGFQADAYVIDSGIYQNNDIAGRIVGGHDFTGEGSTDGCGHGTHVAGIIGGKTWGVAKSVNFLDVRIFGATSTGGCTGSPSSRTIEAVGWSHSEWVRRGRKPAVVNMSLGGGFSQASNDAVNSVVNGGLTVVVAAGNNNANACQYSPASAERAITAGATGTADTYDTRATFSNFGTCVNVFAPGFQIESCGISGPDSTIRYSGTSMATPFVAGWVADFLSKAGNENATPDDVARVLYALSTKDVVANPNGSPNRLMFVDCTTP